MVLVHPDFRRRGIGTALLKHAIRHLREEREIRCVKLDATPDGQPLYEKLGFQAEFGLKRWLRKGPEGEAKKSGEPKELSEAALKLDRQIFGTDRGELLRRLAREGLSVCERPDGSFGLMRDGNRAIYVGPISATDEEAGVSIASELIAQADETRWVFWDFPDANLAAADLARSLGFEPIRDLTRMWLGENATQSDQKRTFGIADFGLG
jgi:GNAT superfamily N-acetyltransferase